MSSGKKADDQRREQLQQRLNTLNRLAAIKSAQSNLLDFTKLTMPDPEDPDNPERSMFQVAKHHRVIAAALEELEAGRMPRLIITLPPRHGKSELVSRRFPAWCVGRDNTRQVIMATYSGEFAKDFGRDVRGIIKMPTYKQIFPSVTFRKAGAAANRFELETGGRGVFVGRGEALTGRGGHILVGDDLLKDAEEAGSLATRNSCWEWLTRVFMTRQMAGAAVVLTLTRWHEDDPVGRLTDPNNPYYSEEEASTWKVIDLPAEARDNDPLGRDYGEPLWPERFPIEFLHAQKRLNPRAYAALYQQTPTPEDGDLITKDMLLTCKRRDIPKGLRIYAASDHAVSTSQRADYTVIIIVGVDEDHNIYILDIWRKQAASDTAVDAMILKSKQWRPVIWWAEKGQISKSIGPFLRKRMIEEQSYLNIRGVTPSNDKPTRAQSIMGMMAMGKVFFPESAPWAEDFKSECLKFPNGRNDDQVDALAYIGLGLGQQTAPRRAKPKQNLPRVGTLGWVKMEGKKEERRQELASALKGW